MEKRAIVIAGGGTGGHVFPGLAVARELRRRDPSRPLVWIGSRSGLEARLVPPESLPLLALRLGGIAGRSAASTAAASAMAAAAVLRCLALFIARRPAAVLGVGGFASGPACLAAVLLRVPLVIHEQNAIAGGTNRFLARFADAVGVSFEQTAGAVRSRRVVVTGNPIRTEFFAGSEKDRKGQTLQSPVSPASSGSQRLSLLIFGGSRGAHSINEAMTSALPHLAGWRDRVSIVHQTGQADFDQVRNAYARAGFDSDVRPFLDDMPLRMRQADLVIGRAGASTIFELAASGKPAILVPFPHAAGGHQLDNARSLEASGAARVVEDSALTGERLAAEIRELLSDTDRLRLMGEAARPVARPDAAARIADLVESAISGSFEAETARAPEKTKAPERRG
ncbi:MAG: undecaprenyldiphospho-muramoylpentapeptide beta-N-acetylglucosaminyltransferase [Acidobacteria bacterium]|nr:MAG: undecaprenyldiphospho-muramoylpentapeptide beta-N-acetylglucosaminyltransferase [Acidobacteriota bacterium]